MKTLPIDTTAWNAALPAGAYFASLEYYRNLVASLYRAAEPEAPDVTAFRAALEGAAAGETPIIAVMTADWCGDSAVTLPFIARLAERADIEMRVARQRDFAELKQFYNDDGTDHIPVVSISRRDAAGTVRELYRWVEAPAARRPFHERWMADHPEFGELYARRNDTIESKRRYTNLYGRLLRDMSQWYRDGLWHAIAEELIRGTAAAATPAPSAPRPAESDVAPAAP